MDELNQYHTPPPYHINQPNLNEHNQRPPYEEDYNYEGYDSSNPNNYNSRVNPDLDQYNTPPPYGPHYEEGFPRPIAMSFWVRYFRYIPHLNLTFQRVNDTFDPKSPVYLESLGLIGCIPAGLLLLTLLVLLLYLLTRCCDHKARTRGAITCCKVACVLCSLLTLAAVGVSVWGSQEVHHGVMAALHALSPINARLITLHTTTDSLTNQVRRHLQPKLSMFHDRVQSQDINNLTVRDALLDQLHYMRTNISEVLLINVEDIAAKMRSHVLGNVSRGLDMAELIRWATTVSVAALLMLVALLLVLGAARHSRPTLITFSVLGLLSLIICWGLTSMYLVASVALSDWCVEPGGPALESWLSRVFSRRVARYYLHCDPDRSSPFTKHLTRAQQSAASVLRALQGVKHTADQHYPREMVHPALDHVSASVSQSQRSLGTVAALLECQPQHQYYMAIVQHTCTTTMDGLVYLLLSAVGSALLFTLLVWLASHTWIYLNAKSDQCSSEERDPFLPGGGGGGVGRVGGGGPGPVSSGGGSRGGTLSSLSGAGRGARHSHTPPQTPPFPGTLNGRVYHHHPHSGTYKSEGGMNGGSGGGAGGPPVGAHHHHHHTATMPRDSHAHASHSHSHSHGQVPPMGPNQGQYATLSKQCKTLESSDFY